jgi:hypothetical protein
VLGEGRLHQLAGDAAGAAGERYLAMSYLAMCDSAAAAGSLCAGAVAAATREVLSGRREEVSIETR